MGLSIDILKITNFGMSHEMDEIYIQKHVHAGGVPLKWKAIESITVREFISASDVWSFGIITLWEIGAMGKLMHEHYFSFASHNNCYAMM